MTLSELKSKLHEVDQIQFALPTGETVAPHFHVTEIGAINKHFVDCGGTIRTENTVNFQLYTAEDFDHRLSVQKLQNIISLSENQLKLTDGEIEVEYQGRTIEKYGLDFSNGIFQLTQKQTDCLAKDKCGIPEPKQKISLAEASTQKSACAPGSGCC